MKPIVSERDADSKFQPTFLLSISSSKISSHISSSGPSANKKQKKEKSTDCSEIISSSGAESGPSAKNKQKKEKSTDCLEIIANEGKPRNRRQNVWDSGKAAGIKEAEAKAAREISVLKSTNDALHTRILALTEQSAGTATGEYVAIKTASDLAVENTQF